MVKQPQTMRDFAFANEPVIRLAAFGGVFVVLAVLEFIVPRRKQAIRRDGGVGRTTSVW